MYVFGPYKDKTSVDDISRLVHHMVFKPCVKVPGPITSDISQTFGDFGIRRKLIFFSLPVVNFTAEKSRPIRCMSKYMNIEDREECRFRET